MSHEFQNQKQHFCAANQDSCKNYFEMSNFLSFYDDKCNGFSFYHLYKSEIIYSFTGLQLIIGGINYFYYSHKNTLPLDKNDY